MDSPFLHEEADEIRLLDLCATYAFKSPGSISFMLHRGDHCQVGRVDVHYPCPGHVKAQLLVQLPLNYDEHDKMQIMIHQLFRALGIPKDEIYQLHFVEMIGRRTAYTNACVL